MDKIIVDVETIPNQNLSDELKPKFDVDSVKMGNTTKPDKVQEKIIAAQIEFDKGLTKKMSLQGNFCQIISLGYIKMDDEGNIFERDVFLDSKNDKSIMERFKKIYKREIIVGWNSKSFDIPVIWKRGILSGVGLIFSDYNNLCYPYSSRDSIDLMHVWNGSNQYGKLMDCAKLLGIPAKSGLDGSMIYDAYKEGRYDEIANYNLEDCDTTHLIYKIIYG